MPPPKQVIQLINVFEENKEKFDRVEFDLLRFLAHEKRQIGNVEHTNVEKKKIPASITLIPVILIITKYIQSKMKRK
jgi:hypothetical protein